MEKQIESRETKKLKQWFSEVKFKKRLFGGLDEKDVWEKLEELNGLYEEAIKAERTRYETMLEVYKDSANAQFNKLKNYYETKRTEHSSF